MGTTAVDAYPDPRLTREVPGRPSSTGIPLPANIPNVRNFSFHVREFSGRANAVSPRYRGPAVLNALTIFIASGVNNNPAPHFQVTITESDIATAGNLALDPRPVGTLVFDSAFIDDQPQSPAGEGGVWNSVANQGQSTTFPLRYPILSESFRVVVSVRNPSINAFFVTGVCSLFTDLRPEDVASFL